MINILTFNQSDIFGATPTGIVKSNGKASRKVIINQNLSKSNSGTLSEILASQSQVRLSNGQPVRSTNGPSPAYPTPQQEYPSTGDAPNGTIPYDLPWTLSPAPKRNIQVICSTLDKYQRL